MAIKTGVKARKKKGYTKAELKRERRHKRAKKEKRNP